METSVSKLSSNWLFLGVQTGQLGKKEIKTVKISNKTCEDFF